MKQIEHQLSVNKNKLHQVSSSGSKNLLLAEIACDDRCVQLDLKGDETVGQIKRLSLVQMQIPYANPNRYTAVGSNRKPLDDHMVLRDILAQGQSAELRLIPQVAFGPTH
jgi:hypothetical protein